MRSGLVIFVTWLQPDHAEAEYQHEQNNLKPAITNNSTRRITLVLLEQQEHQ